MVKKVDVTKHELVPKHAIISEREKKELIEKYRLSIQNFPRILAGDPAIKHLKAKEGDIIKVVRPSKTAGEAVFYRRVTNV
jgi:DNA-directed RNA polymerase subunit H (RpoH/RPB5)